MRLDSQERIMERTLLITSEYNVDADTLWRSATNFDHLAKVVAPLVRFRGTPQGSIDPTLRALDVEVSMFGITPWAPYRMEIVSFDAQARRLISSELGMGLRKWQHKISVEPTLEGARLTDKVTIDAGWKTPIYIAWARYMYKARIPRRRALLADHAT